MSTKAGTAKAVNLIQYCTAWTKVMDRMPPAPPRDDDDGDDGAADPARHVGDDLEHERGALELGTR